MLINSSDYWVKVVGMLEQNWALVEDLDSGAAMIFFISDTSRVFDRLEHQSRAQAEDGLRRNGFRLFDSEEEDFASFQARPEPFFFEGSHPSGPIYSSGRCWS